MEADNGVVVVVAAAAITAAEVMLAARAEQTDRIEAVVLARDYLVAGIRLAGVVEVARGEAPRILHGKRD